MYKIGNFVRIKAGINRPSYVASIKRVDKDSITNNTMYNGIRLFDHDLEPWEPREGEWCWNIEKRSLGRINQIIETKYGTEYYFLTNSNGVESYGAYSADRFEPFIGTLPTFIKD